MGPLHRAWSSPPAVAAVVAALLLTGLLGGGCGPAPHVRSGDAEDPGALVPGFLHLTEDPAAVDPTPLRGRRIVLDPGHGGSFRGAFGPNGLAEADVNLGVALYLRGMLEAAGARVFMTRTTDRDFLAPGDSSLAADLAFRIAFTDSIRPDAFVSIHHNSNPSLDPTINLTQTYFPLGGDGASADLARAVHRHLALNLQISPAQLLPGNFAVLRQATVPAVLGEPAMISHPVMAERLSLTESHRLEAAAYYLGLLEYFTLGVPGWSGAASDTVVLDPADPRAGVSWTFLGDRTAAPGVPMDAQSAAGSAGPGPDPSSFHLRSGGVDVPFDLSPDCRTVSFRPQALSQPVLLELTGRNLAGQATPVRRTLAVPGGAVALRLRVIRETATPAQAAAAVIHWRHADGLGSHGGSLLWNNGLELMIDKEPEGWLLVPDASALPPGQSPLFDPRGDAAPVPCTTREDTLPAGWVWRGVDGDSPQVGAAAYAGGWRRRLDDSAAIPASGRLGPKAPILCVPDGQPVWIEAPGILPLVDPDPADSACPRTIAARDRRWLAAQVLPEVVGRTIVLDPTGGGVIADGTGPLGTRGSDLNLAAARLAAAWLRGAGATVQLTRKEDFPAADQDKVLLAKQSAADLFLSVGRSGHPDSLGIAHYPGSAAGIRWAALMASRVTPLLADLAQPQAVPDRGRALFPTVGPGPDYLLRHTHCPALVLRLPGPAGAKDELALAAPARARAEAAAIVLAIADYLAGDTGTVPTADLAALIAGLPGGLPPAQVDLAVWDGFAVWAPTAPGTRDGVSVSSGGTSGSAISAGSGAAGASDAADAADASAAAVLPARGAVHVLELHAGTRWQLWRLEFDQEVWTPRLMLEER